ncbi:uncharacterized protein EV422DRAFT_328368 [Fimicolochytrium jonesii]|uniref:uncharacterized protein n=1 Tax=Fimicolochytrium jonesii TaxID=1396493 RepID=UPI0022FE5FE6|nr:uncharacterized protein EV422DRAFT_328368 [Fimicolochytrium jonesii]KAI8816153.1 hypothetical protein EV422DRAFT_328368 [Fimicolochytrium jonesii]
MNRKTSSQSIGNTAAAGHGGAGSARGGRGGGGFARGGKKWPAPSAQKGPGKAQNQQPAAPLANKVSKGPDAMTPDQKRQHEKVVFFLNQLIGQLVQVETEANEVYHGIYGIREVTDLGVTLKCARLITKENKEGNFVKVVKIPHKDVRRVSAVAAEVAVAAGPKAHGGEREFLADTAISGHAGVVKERTLQKWAPDANNNQALALEDDKGRGSSHWDQFATNAKLFGVTSDFDEHLYTTKVDRTNPDFKKREQEAIRLAREIERGPVTNSHVAEERNIAFAGSQNMDEEDRYSSVIRGSGKYVPPGARKNSGPSPVHHNQQPPVRAYAAAAASGSHTQGPQKKFAGAGDQQALQHHSAKQQPQGNKAAAVPKPASPPTSPTRVQGRISPLKSPEPRKPSPPQQAGRRGNSPPAQEHHQQNQSHVQQHSQAKKPPALSAAAIAKLQQKTGQAKIAGPPRAEPKPVDPSEVNKVFSDFANNERAALAKRRAEVHEREKSTTMQQFKAFSATFKVPMPIPDDMVALLHKGGSPKPAPAKVEPPKVVEKPAAPTSATPPAHTAVKAAATPTPAPVVAKTESAASSVKPAAQKTEPTKTAPSDKVSEKAPSVTDALSESGKTVGAGDDQSEKGSVATVATAATAPVKKSTFKFNADAAEFTPTFALGGSGAQATRDGNSSGERSPYTNSKRIGGGKGGNGYNNNKGFGNKYPKNQLSPRAQNFMPPYGEEMYGGHPQGMDPSFYPYNMPTPYGYRPGMRPFAPPGMSMPPGAFMHPNGPQFAPGFAPPMYPQHFGPPPPHHPMHPGHHPAGPFVAVTQGGYVAVSQGGMTSPVQAPFGMRSPNQMFAGPGMMQGMMPPMELMQGPMGPMMVPGPMGPPHMGQVWGGGERGGNHHHQHQQQHPPPHTHAGNVAAEPTPSATTAPPAEETPAATE